MVAGIVIINTTERPGRLHTRKTATIRSYRGGDGVSAKDPGYPLPAVLRTLPLVTPYRTLLDNTTFVHVNPARGQF